MQTGDLVSLLIGPRDGNHACDLTAVELKLTSAGDGGRTVESGATMSRPTCSPAIRTPIDWAMPASGIFTPSRTRTATGTAPVIPAGSLLARWQAAESADRKAATGRRRAEAADLRAAGSEGQPRRGPVSAAGVARRAALGDRVRSAATSRQPSDRCSAQPANGRRGRLGPRSGAVRQASGRHADRCRQPVRSRPVVIEVRLPADLVAGCEFVTTGSARPATGAKAACNCKWSRASRAAIRAAPSDGRR